MTSQVTFTLIDNSGEKSGIRFHMPDLSGANYDTTVGTDALDNEKELKDAVSAVSKGNHVQATVTAVQRVEAGSVPADPYAQREIKALVRYEDDVSFKKYSWEVPIADLDALATAGTDVIDITAGAMATFVTAVETYAVSPEGNALTVLSAQIVGRSL